jgi:hypothetical protein
VAAEELHGFLTLIFDDYAIGPEVLRGAGG